MVRAMNPLPWDTQGLIDELEGQDALAGISAAFICLARVMLNAGVPAEELSRLLMIANEAADA